MINVFEQRHIYIYIYHIYLFSPQDFVDLTKDLSSSNESTPVKNEYKGHGFVKVSISI